MLAAKSGHEQAHWMEEPALECDMLFLLLIAFY